MPKQLQARRIKQQETLIRQISEEDEKLDEFTPGGLGQTGK